MEQPVRILAAVDFSAYSGDTLRVAAELARCLEGELVVPQRFAPAHRGRAQVHPGHH